MLVAWDPCDGGHEAEMGRCRRGSDRTCWETGREWGAGGVRVRSGNWVTVRVFSGLGQRSRRGWGELGLGLEAGADLLFTGCPVGLSELSQTRVHTHARTHVFPQGPRPAPSPALTENSLEAGVHLPRPRSAPGLGSQRPCGLWGRGF